jgi:hypothetical protein
VLLADRERYPAWTPDLVTGIVVLDRDCQGRAALASLRLYIRQSPTIKSLDLRVSVAASPTGTIRLDRSEACEDDERMELVWTLSDQAGTRLALALYIEGALLSNVYTVYGLGDHIADVAAVRSATPVPPW